MVVGIIRQIGGLFSGMIIYEFQEAIDLGEPATKEEIDREMFNLNYS